MEHKPLDLGMYKKRKISTAVKFITNVIARHSSGEKWLVEWCDRTRTWETYDVVKDLRIFQDFLHVLMESVGKSKEIPSYIA